MVGGGAGVVGGGLWVRIEWPWINEGFDLHISGLPTFHLSAVPSYDGGQVFVEMQDAQTGMRIGHATMDVRYHEGGSDPKTVTPGQQIMMMMEFQGIDAILPAGHGLRFVLSDTGEDYLAPACGTACLVHVLPSLSTFEAPLIDTDKSNVLVTPQFE